MNDGRPGTSRPMTGRSQSIESTGTGDNTLVGPRPFSRRRPGDGSVNPSTTTRTGMNTARPDSRMSGGGVDGFYNEQQQRPLSKMSRLQSAVRPPTSVIRQGSAAMRMSTARPQSGFSQGALHAQVNVMDRPVTQQGVSGVRTARTSYGNRRMIHDKTYFLGLLHTKMGEITSEIQKLSSSVESLAKEQSTYITYEKRVQELAAELMEMQGELADYNLLSDLIASGKSKADVEDELKIVNRENKSQTQRIETIYNRRRESEKQVEDIEQKIMTERNRAERLVQSLSPELREKYEATQQEHNELQREMEQSQYILDDLNGQKEELYTRVCTTDLRRRAAQLEEEFAELSDKREELYRDADSRETPEEERERLLEQVKMDNIEITTLDRQISQVTDELRIAQDELKGMEQEIEDNDSERQQKFRDLKKREDEMEEFMANFEDNKGKELNTIVKLESEIADLMDKIAKNCHLILALPEDGISTQTFTELKADLEFKEDEFDKAKYTTDMIELRNESLKKQLDNFETLEEKMRTELISLEEKMDIMKKEMIKFEDTDTLKTEAAERSVRLQKESQLLEDKTKKLNELLKNANIEHDQLKTNLDNIEVHRQINGLEKKWSLLEKTNYELSTIIRAKRAETDYEDVKSRALTLLAQLNTSLQIN